MPKSYKTFQGDLGESTYMQGNSFFHSHSFSLFRLAEIPQVDFSIFFSGWSATMIIFCKLL